MGTTPVHQRILKYNTGRDADLLARKYARIAEDPFLFLRGTCHLFSQDSRRQRELDKAPPAWICGDLHLENFGSYKGENRLSYFDLNDFDEAALAPCTWEPARLLVSLHVAARSLKLPKREVRTLARDYVAAYVGALVDGKARWIERTLAQGMVRDLLDQVGMRKRKLFLDRHTRSIRECRRFVIDGEHLLPVTAKERSRLMKWFEHFAASQERPKFYRPLDVARRVAGTGSLGLPRYVAIVRGKGSPNGNYLLDLKQASPSSVAASLPKLQPRWSSEAQRIVTVQKRAQAIAPAFLMAVEFEKSSFVLKELQPTQDRLDLLQAKGRIEPLASVIVTMGRLTAWSALRGSGRQGAADGDALVDFASGDKWRKQILEFAEAYAADVVVDWREYRQAWRDGAFSVGSKK